MVARNPGNALARFGLANELLKAQLWEEGADQLRQYLATHDDEGNAYGRLAEACVALGRRDEALKPFDAASPPPSDSDTPAWQTSCRSTETRRFRVIRLVRGALIAPA
jgi:tetratricopeptide (TPR) repeat protein